jgi:hypothetical protein
VCGTITGGLNVWPSREVATWIAASSVSPTVHAA